MNEWIDELAGLCAAGEPAVLVTVAGIRGSAPRELGARMIVTARETIGTIGGGQLEYQSTSIAAGCLAGDQPQLRRFPLGSSMGQCCGGVVEILFEPLPGILPGWLRDLTALADRQEPAVIATRLPAAISTSTARSEPTKIVVTAGDVYGTAGERADSGCVAAARSILGGGATASREADVLYEPVVLPERTVAVFGAGHVGSAVVRALSHLDCDIRWFDSRPHIFTHVPDNVRAIGTPDLSLQVAAMPAGACYLVMTHSHALDFDICDRILRRRDARYCGLIGSVSKRRRFEKRYRQQGMSQALIDSLVCPIGIAGISGKKPAEIAVAVAAEILRLGSQAANPASRYPLNVQSFRR